MRLVKEGPELKVTPKKNQSKSLGTSSWKDYIPLAIILNLILVTSLVISLRGVQTDELSITTSLSYFMIGFFIVFAGFKLIDLKGFARLRWFGRYNKARQKGNIPVRLFGDFSKSTFNKSYCPRRF